MGGNESSRKRITTTRDHRAGVKASAFLMMRGTAMARAEAEIRLSHLAGAI